MKKLFVTGTDTDVGKTYISSLILRHLVSAGFRMGAYKPVCSGATSDGNGGLSWSDVDILAAAADCNNADLVCPQRFRAAVAPNVAALTEGRTVDDRLLVDGAAAWDNSADMLLIEGAGGLLCPLSDHSLVVDVVKKIDAPVLIVAANRLGVLNHTMLTVEVAVRHDLKVAGIILNNVQEHSDDESLSSNSQQLQHWLPEIPVTQCSYLASSLPQTVEPADWFSRQ